MAFLRFEGAQAPIDLSNAALVAHDATQVAQSGLWRYTNGAGDRIEVFGENFTYDNLNLPTSGSVSTVRIDIGADGGPSDVVVSGLNFDPRHLAENARSFWDGVLAGNDVVNVQGLDIPVVGTAAASVVFGDSLQSQRSTNEGTVTDRGGNDFFITGNGIYTLIGDAHTVEGDQREVFVPPQPGTGTQPPIGGGFVTVTEFARYEAGNDTITGQQTGGLQTFVGDAFTVGGRGTLLGGDDTLSSASFNSGSRMIGDAVTVAGSLEDATFARVEGGDDQITGLDPAGGLGSVAVLIGDVDRVGDFALIQGGADIIRGSARDETITGDVFAINGSDETLIEAGDDDIAAGAGNDRIAGDLFASTLFLQDLPAAADNEPPLLVGGDDLIHGGDGEDVIHGEAVTTDPNLLDRMVGGDDRLFGDAGDDRLFGQTGDDVLVGGAGADEIDGGSGIDTADYSGSAAAVRVSLRFNNHHGGDAQGDRLRDVENVIGSAFDDQLEGDAEANRLDGADGADRLIGSAGADAMVGGAGVDTADYAASIAGVRVDLASRSGLGGFAHRDTFHGIENVVGSAFGDELAGDAAANRLDGAGGDDRLVGGAGADAMIGGDGIDTADYSNSIADVAVDLATGSGLGGFAHRDTLDGVENVVGSVFGDEMAGDAAANRLDGAGGDDRLFGSAGADAMIGGTGIDTADYSNSIADVSVNLATGSGLGGFAHHDTLDGVENVVGSRFGDELAGDSAANRLDGAGGNDRLIGSAGADVMVGGAGNDTADYSGSIAAIRVSLISGAGKGGFAHRDTFSGIENVIGSAFDDAIRGNAGANIFEGGAGDDRFVFRNGTGADRIVDFDAGAGSDDRVDLSGNSLLGSFADILANSAQVGVDTVIDLGGGSSLTLAGVARATLHQDDFIF